MSGRKHEIDLIKTSKNEFQFPFLCSSDAGRGFQTAADRQRFLVFGSSDLSTLSRCVVVCPARDLVGLKTFPVARQEGLPPWRFKRLDGSHLKFHNNNLSKHPLTDILLLQKWQG